MGTRRPEPPPFGNVAPSDGEADYRYVLTYDSDVNAHEGDFESWFSEWMLAWIEDPNVRRVGAEPGTHDDYDRVYDRYDRVVIDTNYRTRVMPDQHRRLLGELDEQVRALTVRREPPTSTPHSVDVEQDCIREVYG